jgi:xylulokinase
VEGVVYAFNYGIEIMKNMGIKIENIRAGNANMFLSSLFGEVFATVTSTVIELMNTDGAQGAARGAGIGIGFYQNETEAFVGLKITKVIEPELKFAPQYREAYVRWLHFLKMSLERGSVDER